MTDWEKLVDWLIAAELGGKGKCTQPGDNDRDDDDRDDGDYEDDDGDGEDDNDNYRDYVMMMTELHSNGNIMDKM